MLVAAASLTQTAVGRTVLRQAGLVTAAPSSTALSFAQPRALPDRLSASRTRLRVPFTIRNDSPGIRSYRWSLDATRVGKPSGLTARPVSRTISLAAGATVTLDPALPLTCRGGQIRVTVRLASPAESIDFLSRCPTSLK